MKSQTLSRITIGSILVTLVAGAFIMTTQVTQAASNKTSISDGGSTASSTRTRQEKARKTATTTVSTRTRQEKATSTSAVDKTCMVKAVETREGNLLTAWNKFNTDLTTAFTARTVALVAAWNNTDAKPQATATAEAWKNWQTAKAATHKVFRSERKEAWETFKTTAKTECKATLPKGEALEKVSSDSISI